MTRAARILALVIGAIALATTGLADEPAQEVRVAVRALAVTGDVVRIDRGAAAGLEPGDRVVFQPLGRAEVIGRVAEVEEREARVEVAERAGDLVPGTPGEAHVPNSRFAVEEQPGAGDRPPIAWEADEEGWQGEMPLLADVRVLSSAERESEWHGRAYLSTDFISDRQGPGRDDSFEQVGLDLRGDNVFGRGGTLRIAGLASARSSDSDGEDGSETRLLLNRFGYTWGGTRDEARRLELGRFLPREFPELGLLDGAEVSWRAPAGHRFGASLGYLPSYDGKRSTGDTFQISSWANFALGADDGLEAGAAVQKTWHEGDADRELLLMRLRWFSNGPWLAYITTWLDFYGSEDLVKDEGTEVTQVIANVTRRIGEDAGASLTTSLVRYPELLRDGLQELAPELLADGENRRVSLSGWKELGGSQRLHGRLDTWTDQESSGGGGELAWERRLDGDRIDRVQASGFLLEGRFTEVLGLRLGTSGRLASGRWRANIDSGLYTQKDFSGEQEELLQHALRLGWDGVLGRDWFFSVTTTYRFGDELDALSAGLLLQRSF